MEDNETILEVIGQWMESTGFGKIAENTWGNEYSEFDAAVNNWGFIELRKMNIEIITETVWIVPIDSRENFIGLMRILEPKQD